MPAIQARFEEIPVGEGRTMRAFFAHPASASRLPAVIVFQEIFGVNGHIQSVTRRLAEAGFATLAPELFHRASPGLELGCREIERGRAERDKIPHGGIEADARARPRRFSSTINLGIARATMIFYRR